MIISFDYDNTLTKPNVLKVAKAIKGHQVIITTSRQHSQEVLDFSKEHNFYGTQFTNYKLKYPFLANVDIHIDDDTTEIKEILSNTNCIAIHTNNINDLQELL